MKITFSFLIMLFGLAVNAQTNCFTNAKQAYDSYTTDRNYAYLKQAEQYAKTCSGDGAYKDNLKFWLLRASISMEMFQYNYDEAYKTTRGTEEQRVADAYASVFAADLDSVKLALFNAETLDKEREWAENFKVRFAKLYDHAYKVGVNTYKAGDYRYASRYFQIAAYACYRGTFSYNKDVITNAALATYQNGDWKEAAEYYHIMYLNEWGGSNVKVDYAYVQFKAGYYDNALSTIQYALEDDPYNGELLLTRAKVYDKQGKTSYAISQLEQLTKRNPDDVKLWYAQAKFLDYVANPYTDKYEALAKPANYIELVDKAEMAYKNAVQTTSKNFYWYYDPAVLCNNACAYCYQKAKDGDNAMQQALNKYQLKSIGYFENAYNINPKHKTTVQALANLYKATGNTTMADKMDKELALLK
jgi:hypothetical protein